MADYMKSASDVLSYKTLVHAVAGSAGSVVGLTTLFPLDTVRTRLQAFDQEHEEHKKNNTLVILGEIFKKEGIQGWYRGWYPVVTSLCCSNFVYFYIYNGLKVYTKSEGESAAAWKDLLMAFTAGVLNVLITTPLWVANTRLKLQGLHHHKSTTTYAGLVDCLKRIAREEGVQGLWSGTGPSLLLAANPALQFMVYDALKRYTRRLLAVEELSGLAYFVIGALAKMVATVATYPLQLVQTKLRAGHGKSGAKRQQGRQMLLQIIRLRGVFGLYQGLEAKLLQTVLMAALMFLTYEEITAFVFRLMGTSKS